MSFKALFDATQVKLREGTVANPIHVRVHSRNQGGFRSTVKIRDFELTIDQPRGFGGGNAGGRTRGDCRKFCFRKFKRTKYGTGQRRARIARSCLAAMA